MSFIASLAAVGTAIAEGAAVAGGALASGAAAAGSGLAAGASALGSGLGALGSGIGLGAAEGAAGAGLTAGAGAAGGAGFAGLAGGTGLTAGTAGGIGSLGAAGSGALSAGSLGLTSGAAGAGTTAGLGAGAASGMGASMGAVGAGTALPMAESLGGAGLASSTLSPLASQALTGAGIGALGGAITNPNDPMGGALKGAGTGAIGGLGAGALAGAAGSGGAMGAIGDFAAAHPYITSGGIGLGANMMIDSAMAPDNTIPTLEMPKSRYAYNKQFNYGSRFAAGGITDLDGYMSNAQNIPNPQEVADPEGYGGSSVQMMAGGGISKLIPGGSDVADALVAGSLPGMIAGWNSASDLPLIGGLFNKPEDVATLTPDEKKRLMGMANQQPAQIPQPQQMAEGGIADLGGYATGGRPNLLHGAGDGVSDSIPASIAGKQPARLAAGEYVVPSRIVSELGNGSTDAGAQRLDEMVKRIQAGRSKTTGSKKQFANDTKAYRHMPA